MSDFTFEDLAAAPEVNLYLRRVLAAPDYEWIAPILEKSTHAFVSEYIHGRVNRMAFPPLRVDSNIAEAGRILNNAFERQREIQDLEVAAVQAALEIKLGQLLQKTDSESEAVKLKAAVEQSGQSADIDALIEARNDLLSSARRSRLRLHAREGSGLHYGQRVTFLRTLLSKNILLAYERLHAIRLGLKATVNLSVDELPEWKDSFTLQQLIFWLQDATKAYEQGSSLEGQYTVFLPLGGNGIADVSPLWMSDSDVTLAFDLAPFHLRELDLGKDDSVRIVAVGGALQFGEVISSFLAGSRDAVDSSRTLFGYRLDFLSSLRGSLSVPVALTVPEQEATFADGSKHTWAVPPVLLGDVGSWSYSSPSSSVRFESDPTFVNSNPFGGWRIHIPRFVRFPWANAKRMFAGAGIETNTSDAYVHEYGGAPTGFLLALRVAVRRAH